MTRGRRSDHTRDELRGLILTEGARLMEEVGYASFSARELARRIGYSVSTVLNTMGGNDLLVMEINTRTFGLWADALEAALSRVGPDRIATLVDGYFRFARAHHRLWHAIYDHRLPLGMEIDDSQAAVRGRLTGIVVREVAAALPEARRGQAAAIARSLIATVHGHCTYDLTGSYALMGGEDAAADALERVRETIAHAATPTENVR